MNVIFDKDNIQCGKRLTFQLNLTLYSISSLPHSPMSNVVMAASCCEGFSVTATGKLDREEMVESRKIETLTMKVSFNFFLV